VIRLFVNRDSLLHFESEYGKNVVYFTIRLLGYVLPSRDRLIM